MTAQELYKLLQIELPAAEAMAGDRLGVQVEPPDHRITRVLTALEITDAVLDEAAELQCDAIVTFHPLIFTPLEALRPDSRVARCVMRAVRLGIAVVSVHTTLDAHPLGTNTTLAQLLDIQVERPLVPSTERDGYGIGIVGRLEQPLELGALAHRIAERLGTTVRYCSGATDLIARVALVAGSGASMLEAARSAGVDAFITADVKYHTFHYASGQIALIDAGHFEMEQHVPVTLARIIEHLLERNGIALEVIASTVRTSPVHTALSFPTDNQRSTISTIHTDANQR